MVSFKNVSFRYNKKQQALDKVSFDIPKGSWVSIVGHNGSGKSTIARLIIGLIKQQEGEVIVDGVLLNAQTVNDIRKKVGFVFQNPDNQFVGVTVGHDIAFGLENRLVPTADIQRIVMESAKAVDMENYIDREPSTLSGGQKQRVAIAGVLAVEAECFVFDEAISMLDPEGTKEVTELITELAKTKTVVTITHDLDFAFRSDYVMVLKEGRILAFDTPKNLAKEEKLLRESNLTLPLPLQLFHLIKDQEKEDALWRYYFKM